MKMLGIDVGSSSVKAAVLVNGKVRGEVVRAEFATRHEGVRVEVDAEGHTQPMHADFDRSLLSDIS